MRNKGWLRAGFAVLLLALLGAEWLAAQASSADAVPTARTDTARQTASRSAKIFFPVFMCFLLNQISLGHHQDVKGDQLMWLTISSQASPYSEAISGQTFSRTNVR